jgi:transposase
METKTKRLKKSYSEEFKRDAVKLALKSDRKLGQVAKNLGVSYGTLRKWIELIAKPMRSKGELPQLDAEARIKELEKENRILKEEREILKKAAAYFAKHQG